MAGMSRSELAHKIDWEGGIDSALEYGIKTADLDQDDIELVAEWDKLQEMFRPFHEQAMKVQGMLPEDWEDDWDDFAFGASDYDEYADDLAYVMNEEN